jgi:hypothetical protein
LRQAVLIFVVFGPPYLLDAFSRGMKPKRDLCKSIQTVKELNKKTTNEIR